MTIYDSGWVSLEHVLKSFWKSQFPGKFVNLFFTIVIIEDKLTDLSGN